MYGNKLATAIKVNGKVLREFKDTVYIPFGSEYSILIKNLNTVRAVVNVFLDGEDVVPGGLVVDPGREVDLERWVKNGNLSAGNRFKFIERTENIENGPRGIKLEDGLVRLEYQFEQPRPVINVAPVWTSSPTWTTTYGGVSGSAGPMFNVNGVMRGVDKGPDLNAVRSEVASYCAQNNISACAASVHDGMATMDWCDTGITVPGSKSEQKFQTAYVGTLESQTHNLVFKLVGDLGFNKPVEKPVTVKHKPKCVTCGKQNKHNAKFCSECGTALEIFA